MKRQLINWVSNLCLNRFQTENINDKKIPVLCYHRFLPSVDSNNQDLLSISAEAFESHMRLLKEHRFNSLSLTEYCAIANGNKLIPDKPVLVTVDDGYYDVVPIAIPIAQKYNIKINLFVLPGETGKNAHHLTKAKTPYENNSLKRYPQLWNTLNWNELKTLSEAGIGIGLHGFNHVPLSSLSDSDLHDEITLAIDFFSTHLNFRPEAFALPYGNPASYSENVLKLLQDKGFKMIFSTHPYRSDIPVQNLPVGRFVVEQHHDARNIEQMLYGACDWIGQYKSKLAQLSGSPIAKVKIYHSY